MWPPGAGTSILALICLFAACSTQEIDPAVAKFAEQQQLLLKQFKADKSLRPDAFHGTPPNNTVTRRKREIKEEHPEGPEHCPPGYTGHLCESPICWNQTRLDHHSGDFPGELIELDFFDQCIGGLVVHVDRHIKDLVVVVTTEQAGYPSGKLFNAHGRLLFPNFEEIHPHLRQMHYENVQDEGTGKFYFTADSDDNEDCVVAVRAHTDLVLDGGFVESPHDDRVQEFVGEYHELQRDPTEFVPGYLAFKPSRLEFPETVTTVTFYRSQHEQQYAPMLVGTRYNCNANVFAGPYVCLEYGIYFVKIRGTDRGGNVWQRVYQFACNANPGPGPGPGPTPEPTPAPDHCLNGGTFVNNETHSYCYCGHHYEGRICETKILLGIDETLEIGAANFYRNSPIIVFTDALPDDPPSTRFDILQRLNEQSNPIYIIAYGGLGFKCNPDIHTEAYEQFRVLAQFSGGLVVKATETVDEHLSWIIWRVAYTLSVGLYNEHLLAANDLLDSCQYAPNEQVFFVDDSIEELIVAFVGRADYDVNVVNTIEEEVDAFYIMKGGDLTNKVYRNLEFGNYRLVIKKGQNSSETELPCHYRVYAKSKYEVFTGASIDIDHDLTLDQPRYNEEMHIVARVNNIEFPDPENVFAEALIWHNSIFQHDKREVLYASNGVYRDGCDYNLYFGTWKCERPNQFFYVEVYVEDATGLTVKRTSVGHCTVRDPNPPDQGCRNGGVRSGDRCLCVPGYEGKNCENIVCYNEGRSHSTHCECYAPWSGPHCTEPKCGYKNQWVDFRPRGVGLSFVIQGSSDVQSTLVELNRLAPEIVRDFKFNDPYWISHYSIHSFDDKQVKLYLQTDHPDDLIHGFEALQQDTQNTESVCKDLLIYEAIIEALTSSRATAHEVVYLVVSGGIKLNEHKEKETFQLIDALGAKINIIQYPINKCRIEIDQEASTAISTLAHYSGGSLYQTNRGTAFITLPLQYDEATVFDEIRDNCDKEQTFYFPISGNAQTVSITSLGDLRRGYPKISAAENTYVDARKVYDSAMSRLNIVYKDCPDGWQPYEQNCYLLEVREIPWDDAKATCMMQGGHLLHIANKGLDDLMSLYIGGTPTWIGLNDQNSHDWGWDQGAHDDLPLGNAFKHWAAGEPKSGKHCAILTSGGWVSEACNATKPFICQKHAYDLGYNPGGKEHGHLARGIWSVKLRTYNNEFTTCGIRVNVQSATQVFRQFTKKLDDDFGNGALVWKSKNNRIIAHLESHVNGHSSEARLEYAHLYPSETANLGDVVAFHKRDQCSYDYISNPFTASNLGYYVGFTGFDAYGYPFQRVLPAVSEDSIPTCKNGGVLSRRTEECVCPPEFRGRECQIPNCKFGYAAPNGVSCKCFHDYEGPLCQYAICLRNDTDHPPPPMDVYGKSFIIVLDGSNTANNAKVAQNFNKIIAEILDRLGNTEHQMYHNYIGILAYDKAQGEVEPVSKLVVETDRSKFLNELQTLINDNYQSRGQKRDYLFALAKVISSKDVIPGSAVYVIGDSGVEDAKTWNDQLYNHIAEKHVTIHTIILNDQVPPGNASNYRDPSIQHLLGLPFVTDGFIYQVDPDRFKDLFYIQLGSRFRGYSLTHQMYRECSDKIEYFQTGGDYGLLVVDLFTAHMDLEFDVIDPNGNSTDKAEHLFLTGTNVLFTIETNIPGIWTIQIHHKNKPSACFVSVREVANTAPAIGFNTDIRGDNGLHSRSAQYYPQDGLNAIIANSDTDHLTYAQVYTHDAHTLAFASPLVRRHDCAWNYISSEPFKCPASTFTVAVVGYDRGGHPYRRTYKTHCVGYKGPRTPTLTAFSDEGTSLDFPIGLAQF
uniref:EGF-like domain-containing protein n=1 Tax=Bursaphelenchus xylophilus TaxID=6326 RepID=A0A1I7SFP3_BURXY